MNICRVDQNQKRLVEALRQMGMSVQHLHALGKGCPDLLIGFQGRNYLFEVKNDQKPQSKKRLTPDQQAWHAAWRGQVGVVENIDQVLERIQG